jgi:cell wall assembly regulator SMI1
VRYRHLEFSASSPAPASREIAAIEAAVGAKLPSDFKAFLRDANGATLPYAIHLKTGEVDDSLNFRQILDTGGEGEDTFLGELAALRARWRIPAGILPFARAYGGSVVCLDLRPASYGAVIALLDDSRGGTGEMEEPPFVRVADSFHAYIDSLVPELSEEAFGEKCPAPRDSRSAG